jgi:hypothetical protein
MQKKISNEEIQEEEIYEEENVKFGYGATIVFLIFIAFVIYISVTK